MATRNTGTVLSRRPEDSYVPLSQAVNRLLQDSFLLPSFFEGYGGVAGPAGTNLYETGDSYVVQAAMPGMRADSLRCSIEQNVLTVEGEPALRVPEQAAVVWQSFGGQAAYRVQLPTGVEAGSAEATYEAGVLTIRLPKAQHARTHTIKVATR